MDSPRNYVSHNISTKALSPPLSNTFGVNEESSMLVCSKFNCRCTYHLSLEGIRRFLPGLENKTCVGKCLNLCYVCNEYTLSSSPFSDKSDWRSLSHIDAYQVRFRISSIMSKFDERSRAKGIATSFDAVSTPCISISAYSERLMEYFKCSVSCFVIAIILLDRAMRNYPRHVLFDPLSAHRLLAAAFTIAAKSYDDRFHPNSYYAQVVGVSVSELNRLEVKFLLLLNHRTLVPVNEFHAWFNALTPASQLSSAFAPLHSSDTTCMNSCPPVSSVDVSTVSTSLSPECDSCASTDEQEQVITIKSDNFFP